MAAKTWHGEAWWKFGGARSRNGMVNFHRHLTVQQSAAIRAYIVDRARALYDEERSRP